MRYDPFAGTGAPSGTERTAVGARTGPGSRAEMTSQEVEGFDVWEDEGGTVARCPPEVRGRCGKRHFDEASG